jgi:hypothetical protein
MGGADRSDFRDIGGVTEFWRRKRKAQVVA